MPAVTPVQAEQAVRELKEQLSPDFNLAGINTVLALRSRYGRPQKPLTDPTKYFDCRYLAKAIESRSLR